MTKWAILGGGGGFGVNTALHILQHAEPEKVIGIGRNPLRVGAFSLGLEHEPRFEYHARHVTHELDLLLELFDAEKPEIIINYAAQGEGAVSWKHSWRFFETNCVGLSRLVEELGKRDYLQRFIHIGTSELYGSVDGPAKENAPIQPSSPYSASKAAFDLHLLAISKHLGFPMNILRPCNAYCPAQLLHRVIPRAFWSGLKYIKLPLHGGGRAEKSYIHARDLAEAILRVAEKAPLGTVYNVGADQPTSIRDVVAFVANQLGIAFEDLAEVTGERLGQDSRYWLDSSAIQQAVGWKPRIGWSEGLASVHRWASDYWDELRLTSTQYVLRA